MKREELIQFTVLSEMTAQALLGSTTLEPVAEHLLSCDECRRNFLTGIQATWPLLVGLHKLTEKRTDNVISWEHAQGTYRRPGH